MELTLTEEQRALQDSIERLMADHYGMAQRDAYAREPAGWSVAQWQRYAQLGLLGLTVDPEHGGSGLGAAELMVATETLGRALVLEPWLSTVVIGAQAIARAGSVDQQRAWLPRIVDGTLTIAWAHDEQPLPGSPSVVNSTATPDAEGWVVNALKPMVVHGDSADRVLLSARRSGGGLALFLIDPRVAGVSREGFATQDGRRAAHLRLRSVRVAEADRLGSFDDATPEIERLHDLAVASVCAEAIGVMQEMLDLTVAYLKTRQQFGVAIGSFQALQHRAVDMLVALDSARSMALFASAMTMEPDPMERRRAMAAAKVQIGRSARLVGQQAVQLHGGMGMSMETKLARCFLRASAIEYQFGATDDHLRELARLGGFISAGEPA